MNLSTTHITLIAAAAIIALMMSSFHSFGPFHAGSITNLIPHRTIIPKIAIHSKPKMILDMTDASLLVVVVIDVLDCMHLHIHGISLARSIHHFSVHSHASFASFEVHLLLIQL